MDLSVRRPARPPGRPGRRGAVAAAALLAAALVAGGAAPAAGSAVPAMVLLGTNPGSAAQPTADGRWLRGLAVHAGRVWMGVGDYTANTGPSPVVSYDPATRGFRQEWVSDTEAVHRFRVLGDRLYAPATDRKVAADYAVRAPDGTWSDRSGLGSDHLFDVGTATGSDLWAVGSAGAEAVAWRSTDHGTTWQRAYVLRRAGAYPRFTNLWSLGGSVWLQEALMPTAVRWTGGGWTDSGLDLWSRGLFDPVVFAGRLVGRGRPGGTFDGTSFGTLPFGGPVAVGGRTLYVLDTRTRTVHATEDLRAWRPVATVPAGTLSLAATADGRVYAGTAAGTLWGHEPPVPGPDPAHEPGAVPAAPPARPPVAHPVAPPAATPAPRPAAPPAPRAADDLRRAPLLTAGQVAARRASAADTRAATRQHGERPVPGSWGRSTWLAYRPSRTGPVTVSTSGALTSLAWRTGRRPLAGGQVAVQPHGRRLTAVLRAGTTYWLRIDTSRRSGRPGPGTVTVAAGR